ncbi:MAG: hypothetical protein IT324_31500 [Anaerolineae bacterium]|nr:hypothetical protein [Anaerolineae bacterium]
MNADASRLTTEWFKRLTAGLSELPPADEFSFWAHQMAWPMCVNQRQQGRAAFVSTFEATVQQLYQAASSDKEP